MATDDEDVLWYPSLADPKLTEVVGDVETNYTGEEARARLVELAAHNLLFGEFHYTLFDPAHEFGDEIIRFALRHAELVRKYESKVTM